MSAPVPSRPPTANSPTDPATSRHLPDDKQPAHRTTGGPAPTRGRAYRGHHRRRHPALRLLPPVAAALVFATGVLAANWLTARYGLIGVGFGLTATAGTYAAGLCLLARDWVHDTAGRAVVLCCIAAGAIGSAITAGPRLALASAAAFAVSELADLAIYQPLRRHGWVRAVLASNTVGAPVDTVLFLALAGFPIWGALPGQLLAKTVATAVPVAALVAARALLRHRLRPPRS